MPVLSNWCCEAMPTRAVEAPTTQSVQLTVEVNVCREPGAVAEGALGANASKDACHVDPGSSTNKENETRQVEPTMSTDADTKSYRDVLANSFKLQVSVDLGGNLHDEFGYVGGSTEFANEVANEVANEMQDEGGSSMTFAEALQQAPCCQFRTSLVCSFLNGHSANAFENLHDVEFLHVLHAKAEKVRLGLVRDEMCMACAEATVNRTSEILGDAALDSFLPFFTSEFEFEL